MTYKIYETETFSKLYEAMEKTEQEWVDMSKIYHQSMTDGPNSNVATTYSIFSSMLKNHESHLR